MTAVSSCSKNAAKPNVDAVAKQQERGCPPGACTAQRLRAEELVATRVTIKLLNDDVSLELFKETQPSPALMQVRTSGCRPGANSAQPFAWISTCQLDTHGRQWRER